MSSRFEDLEEDDDDGQEADWKDSYSDLMTDLLAVFVLLLSFAMINQSIVNHKVKANNTVDITPMISVFQDQTGVLPDQNAIQFEEDNFNKLYESIKEYIKEEGLSEKLSVTKQGNDRILLRVSDSVFFKSGSADINSSAEPFLGKASEMFTRYREAIKIVRIEGHTDNRPIKNSKYDSNWELSSFRAVNVLRQIVEISQLEPKMFSAVGYSEFYPIDTNDTSDGRAKNRRVDFFIEAMDSYNIIDTPNGIQPEKVENP